MWTCAKSLKKSNELGFCLFHHDKFPLCVNQEQKNTIFFNDKYLLSGNIDKAINWLIVPVLQMPGSNEWLYESLCFQLSIVFSICNVYRFVQYKFTYDTKIVSLFAEFTFSIKIYTWYHIYYSQYKYCYTSVLYTNKDINVL